MSDGGKGGGQGVGWDDTEEKSREMEKAHQCIRDSTVRFVPLAVLQRGRGGG